MDSRIRGNWNRREGDAFERLIDAGCVWYRNQGIAAISKTPEPMKIIKPMGNGRFEAIFAKKAQPDYKGVLRGGTAVVFEAKSTSTGRMEQNRVTEAQTEELELYWRLEAEVFVLIDFDHTIFARIPWVLWRDMKGAFGHKHLTPGDCVGLTVPLCGTLKFLEGIA